MYQLDWGRRGPDGRDGQSGRPPTVWYLGWTSCLTDISSEMVNGILPLYLVGYLRLSPLQFGVIDGLYQGVSAVLAPGWRRRGRPVAAAQGNGRGRLCAVGGL